MALLTTTGFHMTKWRETRETNGEKMRREKIFTMSKASNSKIWFSSLVIGEMESNHWRIKGTKYELFRVHTIRGVAIKQRD